MKRIILMAIFICSGAFATGIHNTKDEDLKYAFVFWNIVYEKIFRHDLWRRVERLAEEAGGRENINPEDLRPRPEFTRPHRLKLMNRFAGGREHRDRDAELGYEYDHGYARYSYGYFGDYYDRCEAFYQRRERCISLISRRLSETNGIEFRDPLLASLVKQYVVLSEEHFSLSVNLERYDDNIDYPEIKHQVKLVARSWTNPTDRWWFNENIKPLLENMIMIWDLDKGEYEPY